MTRYCLTFTNDPRYRFGNSKLIIVNKSILEDQPFLKSKKLSNKFNFRINISNYYKYFINLDTFAKKKFFVYKKQLISILNKYHNFKENKEYWDKIISSWLFDAICITKIRLDELLPFINKKVFIISLEKENYNFLNNSYDLVRYSGNQNYFNQFIYSRIAEVLKIKKKKLYKEFKIQEIVPKNNYFLFFFYFFYRLYIKFFKPIVLVNCYINFIDRLKIILRSKGLIIFPNENHLFKSNFNSKIDFFFRSKIEIKEKDYFDKVFNKLLQYLLPTSFVEDFFKIKKNILDYSLNIRRVGSAICFITNDRYKILTAELLKKNKKPIIFDHGHVNNTLKYQTKYEFEYKNIHEHICYSNKNGLGVSNLRRLNINYKKQHFSKITLFTTKANSFFYLPRFPINVGVREKVLIENFNFYHNLKKEIKNNFFLRPYPHQAELEKKLWVKKFGNKINFSCGTSRNIIQKSKIIITSYFSTTVYEALFLDKPTIIYINKNEYNFKRNFELFIDNLINVGIIYDNSTDAANFINKKYFLIEDWWFSSEVRKVIKLFRERYCIEKKNFANIFTKHFLEKQ